VRQLLALAVDSSTTEEERRTAAVQAARLIAEHGFAVTPVLEVRRPDGGVPAAGIELARRGLQVVRLSRAFPCFDCFAWIGDWGVRISTIEVYHLACYLRLHPR